MNTAIDYMLLTGRWEKMTEKYGATGRFYSRPELVPFGMSLEEKK
jgi:polar amino acid transport system substrate-binding protein